jgi:Uma2 family endonuclease
MLSADDLPYYTYEDYALWEGRWELIEGIPYAMTPSPGFQHQKISQQVAYILGDALDDCKSCQAVLPVDWIVAEDTILQPDNMVICYQPVDKVLTKAPSLIFEILSPSTAHKDRRTKYAIYEREGVRYYCIVDPANRACRYTQIYPLATL